MNDRLRFRVWDKRLNRYLGEYDPIQMIMSNGNLAYLDDYGMKFYEVEQCTGLTDRNGRLIYENDLVKLLVARNRGWIPKGTIAPIEWNNFACCGFVLGDNSGNLTEKCAKNCEVIGNIHENKELLK